jgi:hypothetical protein
MTSTMLEEKGGRVPTDIELDEAYGNINTEAVEYLRMSLDLWREDIDLVLTAEQAWHLTYFARSIELLGESLRGWGKEIAGDVEAIMANLVVAGGDDA